MTDTISYDDVYRQARTGDILLFHGTEWSSEVIEIATGGDFSHSAMIVRSTPDAVPLIWQESGIEVTTDPRTGDRHTGAQLGELDPTLAEILTMHDTPTYRPLVVDRTDEFEATIQDVITRCEGVPFPSIPDMAERWIEGHLFDVASTTSQMFCSQLVAFTYQAAKLLAPDPPPNYYSPVSFSDASDDVHLLLGASFGPQTAIDINTLPPAPPEPPAT